MIKHSTITFFALAFSLYSLPSLSQNLSDEIILSNNTEANHHAYADKIFEIDNGRFVALWKEVDSEGQSDALLGKIFTPNGEAESEPFVISSELELTTPNTNDYFWGVDGAYNAASSTFATVWVAQNNGYPSIYFQSYNLNGSARFPQPILLYNKNDFIRQPKISPLENGSYFLVWTEDNDNNPLTFSGNTRSLTSIVSANGQHPTPNLTIGSANIVHSVNSATNNRHVVFRTPSGINDRISVLLYSNGYYSKASTTSLNSGTQIVMESIRSSALTSGDTLAIWRESIPGEMPNLFGAIFDQDINLIRPRFEITQDHISGVASVASISDNEWLVAWSTTEDDEIASSVFDQTGTPTSPRTVLHQHSGNEHFFDGSLNIHVASRANGGQLLTWTDDTNDPFTARAKTIFSEQFIDNTSDKVCPLDGWVLIAAEIDFLVPLPDAQWETSSAGTGFAGENYHMANASKPVSFTWNFTLDRSGYYNIYTSIPDISPETATSNASYLIQHQNGSNIVNLDQTIPGNRHLGAYSFQQGVEYSVKLTGQANSTGVLVADQITISNQ